ncbi:hypothetical protein BKA01_007002 [Pseudonocardia eucalypti]|nr:hypothetical protein [Pseudonocardia eucalypti]
MTSPAISSAAAEGDVLLSDLEFDICWELLRLGTTPATLELPSPGRTWPERRQLVHSVLEALRRRDMAGPSGLSARLASALRLLAAPTLQLDLRLQAVHGDSTVVIGAVADSQGVLVTKHRDEITLQPIRAPRLATEVTERIGPINVGIGRTVHLPTEVLDAAREATAGDSLWAMADYLADELGVTRLDARACARMCTDVEVLGQIGTTFYTNGTPWVGPWVIGFHRTRTGHYLQLRKAGTVTVCPLSDSLLAQVLDQLIAEGPAAALRASGRS